MDVKQRNLMEQTLQYAIDEEKHEKETGEPSHFNMASWLRFTRWGENAAVFKPIPGIDGEWFAVENASLSNCGTAACLAGTAVMLNGSDVVVATELGENSVSHVLVDGVEIKTIADRAQALLGISDMEAHRLFQMTTHTVDQVVAYGEELAGRYGHKLELVW